MHESPAELLRKIRRSEDGSIEFKEAVFSGGKMKGPERSDLADELAAFANGRGGTLLLGIEDGTREIVGIPRERQESVERFVSEVVHDSIEPPLYPDVDWCELPGADGQPRAVLRVEVERSLFVHRSPGGYSRRVGSGRRRLAPEYLARLFQQRSQERMVRFDEEVVAEASVEELNLALIDRFRTPRTRDDRDTLARKLAIVSAAGAGVLKPTVAGILIASDHPETWLRSAFIQAVAYRGTSVANALESPFYQLDARDIVGPLDVQVADACHFVAKNQKVAARKTMGRFDLPQYDMTAVFEAVVNAVAHRDYAVYESKIRLQMFSDRIELYSPGGLSNTLTVDTLEYRQASRNETITSLLAKCTIPEGIVGLETQRETMMDRRGEGVPVILDRSERLSGRRPEYRLFSGAELRLTIYAADPDDRGST